MKFHLRPLGDASRYSDYADYPEIPAARPGFEWVTGEPPPEAQIYQPPNLATELNAIFQSLAPEVQADLAPLKAAVKLELDQDRPQIAALIIQRAAIAAELEAVRQQMLACFNP